ncbi:hypothetical protein IQ273_08565 [Nodosilinea sp. LEGE 07298]|uniref:hypothetical protein n=1 Tax=Nodosilinea sp. LEGE 07298 TaxID=2777970 RepID=UPI001880E586|nr:hypothetical protein [Nodosilinea sp. LEGE 07298]MBE9109467.1 hypothetical protein [Nodosilinea sp. LEGE 07298]
MKSYSTRFRQGDVLLIAASPVNDNPGTKQSHLVLAHGEASGHQHQITEGQAELYEKDGTMFLYVLSETALLTHEEHAPIAIPQGTWIVRLQREYNPEPLTGGWSYVED